MISPLLIEFQDTRPLEDVESRVRQEFAELEKFYDRLVSCRVRVEVPSHERRGSVAKVRIDFEIPASDVGIAEADRKTEHLEVKSRHKDAAMAVHAAFNIARRRMEELTGGS